MRKEFPTNLGTWLRFSSWLTALIGIVVIKAVLSLAVKPGSFLVDYSGISYFLLLFLATCFAIRNGIENRLGARPFWLLLAIAYGLWAFDQWLFLYYELGLHIEVPDNSIADPLLFLHIVPLMAAVATFPHRDASDRKLYRAIFNSLLLLSFWSFLYGYTVFPYQYLFSNGAHPNYALRFDILYLLENLALVLGVGSLALRVPAPWKSIYLHISGASALYALSSTVANLAIDSGGYVNGKLYGLGLTASVCWFVWIPLRARQIPEAKVRITRADSGQVTKASSWAMFVVVVIAIPIVWEMFHRNENSGMRTLRLLVAIGAIVCLASAAYIKEHLAKRELVLHLGVANDRLRLAMQAGTSVTWESDVKSGRDLWFGDLQTIFGIPSDTHVASVEEFLRYVHEDDRQQVSEALADARQNRKLYAAEFRIVRPDGTVRWLVARGEFYYAAKGNPERMLGVSLDITERKLAEEKLREYERAVEGSEEMIAVVNREYRYLIANRMFLNYRSMTREQVVGRLVPEVLNKGVFETVVKEKLDECFRGKVVRYEMRYTYPLLGERYLFISNFPIEGPGGVDRVACILQDITERKRAEEALSSMSRTVIEAEERERSRIARDLHEDIGQRLALLAIGIEQLKSDLPNQRVELLNRMSAVWKQSVEILTDVKASAHELYSPRLEYLGIAAVMRSFCQEFGERKGVEISFTDHSPPSLLLPDVSVCLFRVLQESLHNGVKHSGAQKFDVQLWGASDEIHLTVSDSGAGFNLDAATKGRGLGLIRMEQRLRLVKGAFSIDSQPSRGTTIHARVPINKAAGAVSKSIVIL
ncbi:MAG TPA: PAS domain S-box protein [Candidatus Acidoferrum sp.]|nr:PAS domain S-box protein [Candidatus Acidoferrum sp.]